MNTKILHDADIREPLFDYLEERIGKIRILEEKQTGRARADVVMVTERYLCGIEIKSDADTYARLKKQVIYYDRYYDRNIVEKVQQSLNELGYNCGTPDGNSGPNTQAAITKYYNDNGFDFESEINSFLLISLGIDISYYNLPEIK